MNHSRQNLPIGRLAQRAGVGVDTVRFYERAGLLPKPVRTASGYRMYGEDDVSRLRFIRRSKALGFSLEEISELLALSAGKGGRAGVKAVAERRLHDLDRKLKELKTMRDTLAHYARQCSGHGPVAGCPIVEAVLAHEPTLENDHAARTPAARSR
jgi:MerR family copper efflux transcriptional regulator